MLKIEKKNTEAVEIYGQTIQITLPSVKQVMEYKNKSKESDFDDFAESISFLLSIGVPQEILDQLSADDFNSLISYIFTPKKK